MLISGFWSDFKSRPLLSLICIGNYVRDWIVSAGNIIGQDLSAIANLACGICWVIVVTIILSLVLMVLRLVKVIINIIREIHG